MLLVDKRITIVDTGARGSAGRVLAYIVGLGRRLDEVERIVLTHAHPDHSGSLAEIYRATGAPVCVHASEAGWVAGEVPAPALVAHPLLDQVLRPVTRTQPVPVTGELDDGDVLPILGGARVLHVPGHTRGSIALHVVGRRTLIVGDALQVRWGRLTTPSRLFTEDMAAAKRSIRRLAEIDVETLVFSHYRPRHGSMQRELAELAARIGRAHP